MDGKKKRVHYAVGAVVGRDDSGLNKNVAPWRGVEPRSRAAVDMTGACTNPIYYQGHILWLR